MARDKIERSGDQRNEAEAPTLSIAELRQLVTLMNHSDIEEIGIEEEANGLRLTLRKPAPVTTMISEEESLEIFAAEEVDAPSESRQMEIKAPLVGVFRHGMKPGARPLVSLGDVVREGQVIAAVEALNVYNEVEAPAAGRLTAIYAADGQRVEFGQPLVAIEPLS